MAGEVCVWEGGRAVFHCVSLSLSFPFLSSSLFVKSSKEIKSWHNSIKDLIFPLES